GAGFLYNLMLAKLAGRKELEEEHRANIDNWKNRLLACPHINLHLSGLWELTAGRGHTITTRTKEFVTSWYLRALAVGGKVADDPECREMIENREKRLKVSRSRFTNARARDQWKGYAGVGQLAYRWSNVKTLLDDLYAGLNGGNDAKP
ncbi:MAG: DUF6361 family protein, partial [Syntrophaceae bacterium]|nr:DUF6361 family protein [Syntrophaceae bacterium]